MGLAEELLERFEEAARDYHNLTVVGDPHYASRSKHIIERYQRLKQQIIDHLNGV